MSRQIFCWNCGAPNHPDSQFCDQCSAPLIRPGAAGRGAGPAATAGAAPGVSQMPAPPVPPPTGVSAPAPLPEPAQPHEVPPAPPPREVPAAAPPPVTPPSAAVTPPPALGAPPPVTAPGIPPVAPPRLATPPAPTRPAARGGVPPVLMGGAVLALVVFLGIGLLVAFVIPPGGTAPTPTPVATVTSVANLPAGATAATHGDTPGALATAEAATAPPAASAVANAGAPGPAPLVPCTVFPADNIWNRNIAALPTAVRSDAYIASIGADEHLQRDFASGLYEDAPIGFPYAVVPGNQPAVPVTFDAEAADESDPGPYPIPTNAPLEGGTADDAERHAIVIDSEKCILYEIYQGRPTADGSWQAYAGAHWDLHSNTLRPADWTSADAAGLPIFPGLVRYEEVAAGAIHHALRFTAPRTQTAYIWPARHQAGDSDDADLPPMGLRVRLKAGYDISGFPPQVQVILQALKDYGMFLADNGSPWFISGVADSRWDNDLIQDNLKQVVGSDFEAVDESSLMVSPDSAQSR